MFQTKDQRIAELEDTLREIAMQCDNVARDGCIDKTERRTWRAVADLARAPLKRHA